MPCNYLCFRERENKKSYYVVIYNSIYPNSSYHVLVVTYNSIYLILEMHPKLSSQGSTIVTVPEEEHFQEHDEVIGQCHSTSNYKFNRNQIPFLKTINKMKL